MRMFLLFVSAFLTAATSNPINTETEIFNRTVTNFNITRIYGKWYEIAMTVTNWDQKKTNEARPPMGTVEFKEGKMDKEIQVVVTRMRNGICTQQDWTYLKTDVPGKLNYYNQKDKIQIQSNVIFINYEEFAVIAMQKNMSSKTITIITLYGRTPELRNDLLLDFVELSADIGTERKYFRIFNNEGECTPGDTEEILRRTTRSVYSDTNEDGSGFIEHDTPFKENRAGSCHLHPAPGPCSTNSTRYFYNTSSMACESFQYGGCLGNYNNFHTEQECLHTCRTKASCHIPFATGSCKSFETRWAFDKSLNKCVTFQYGGCEGNSNHFYTEVECKDFCGVLTGVEEGFL